MGNMRGLQTVVVKFGHHKLQRPRGVPGEWGGGQGGAWGRGIDLPREGGDLHRVVPGAGALEVCEITLLTKSFAEIIELHHAHSLSSAAGLSATAWLVLKVYCWYHDVTAVIPLHRHHAITVTLSTV